MPDLLVVVGQQVFGLFANFTQRAEDVHVQHAARVAAVEAFDKPFCIGRPCTMKSSKMPLRSAHSAKANATNSGPLSKRSLFG